jgi:site-specific recombinase XerD
VDQELVRAYVDHLISLGHGKFFRNFSRNILKNLLQWLKAKGIQWSELTPVMANDFLYSYVVRGAKRQYTYTVLRHLRVLGRYTTSRGLTPGDPSQGISVYWLNYPGGYPAYRGPLRQIFTQAAEAYYCLLPGWTPYWELFLQDLLDKKYDTSTISCIAHNNRWFYGWLRHRKMDLFQVRPRMLDGYIRELRIESRRGYHRHLESKYIRTHATNIEKFLTFAFRQKHRPFRKKRARPDNRLITNRLIDAYLAFCRDHGGIVPSTLRFRDSELLRFRAFLVESGIHSLRDVTIETMDAYFQSLTRRMSSRSLAVVISVHRAFFRFLFLRGKYPYDLGRQMDPPSRYSADTRPKYIPWAKIEAFLDSLDRSTAVGKRNFALAVLLAHHGIRRVEAARLKISEIDWKQSSMLLNNRKNGTSGFFPLTTLAHAAMRDYIAVRPVCSCPEVFVTSMAPYRPLGTSGISHVVDRQFHQYFGDSLLSYGPHTLRHSFAKSLLDRGATLSEIGAMLGHKRLNNTFIYSRINTKELSEVADNYASLLP